MSNKPTTEQIWNEELGEPVHTSSESIRWGERRTEVYLRDEDHTFWRVVYRIENQGDYNELREGDTSVEEVVPVEVTTVKYEPIKDKNEL